MIWRQMEKRHLTGAEIARNLQKDPASLRAALNRPTMQVNKLADLSEYFQYNFFREIAETFPYSAPDYSVKNDRTEIETLETKVRDLEMEVKILKQVIKDLKIK